MATATLREVSAATPATRDRYVDFLRAASIAMVVLGHYLGTVITDHAGRVGQHSLLEVSPQLKILTWILQIMPVFFFVGGFSNLVSLEAGRRRGETVGRYLRRRMGRLLTPSLAFLGAWTGFQVLLHLGGWGGTGLVRVSGLPFGPLWFLGVYLGVVAVSPVMASLHRRYRGWVVIGLGVAAGAVDLLHHGMGIGWIGWANFGFVWLLAHQLGFFYADGTLVRCSRRALGLMAGSGFLALVGLTASGLYPVSMVGNASDRFSNMSPPTLAIVALTVWLVGLVLLARPAASRWLAKPEPWMAVVAANRTCMTVYLWHLTAMLVSSLVALHLGTHPSPLNPLFLPVAFGTLALLVAVFGRFERAPVAGGWPESARGRLAGVEARRPGCRGPAVPPGAAPSRKRIASPGGR